MRITQEADYAMRIVCLLAQLESGELDLTDDSRSNTETDTSCENDECRILGAAEITARTMVPPRFTLTILRKMVMSGLVESFKGKNGGYKLSKMPDEARQKLATTLERIINEGSGGLICIIL